MSINKYRQYLIILSEDDAYKDIANGFVNHHAIDDRQIHVAQSAGGWQKLLDLFSQTYLGDVRNCQQCHVLLLLDLDDDPARRTSQIRAVIPNDDSVSRRVFFLCCADEAEALKRESGHGTFEDWGNRLAESCYNSTYDASDSLWHAPQLKHNADELKRLATAVRPLLFRAFSH